MPAVDLETTIYTRLWTLLEANQDWSKMVSAGNRIRFDNIEGLQNPEKGSTNDADFPQAELWIQSGSTNLYTNHETFDTYSDGGPHQPWLEKHVYTFRLVLKSDLLKLSIPDRLGAESRKALRAGGPRLGLPDVTRWVLAWTTTEQDRDNNDQVRRWRTVITITVQVETDGSSLQEEV